MFRYLACFHFCPVWDEMAVLSLLWICILPLGESIHVARCLQLGEIWLYNHSDPCGPMFCLLVTAHTISSTARKAYKWILVNLLLTGQNKNPEDQYISPVQGFLPWNPRLGTISRDSFQHCILKIYIYFLQRFLRDREMRSFLVSDVLYLTMGLTLMQSESRLSHPAITLNNFHKILWSGKKSVKIIIYHSLAHYKHFTLGTEHGNKILQISFLCCMNMANILFIP